MLEVDSLFPQNAFAHRSFILFTSPCSLSYFSFHFSLLYFIISLALQSLIFSYLKLKIAFKHSSVNSDKEHCQTSAGRLSMGSITLCEN
jgi:hypothetical protein